MTVVVAGGSGFIGTLLTQKLLALGDMVIVVDQKAPVFTHEHLYFIQSDIATEQLPFNVLEHTDAVINLVGAPLMRRWTSTYKKTIRDSRLLSTRHIVESMQRATNRPPLLINASAVGYYGDGGDTVLNEQAPQGKGFLAEVAAEWEKEALQAEAFGTRVVCVRTAIVLGRGEIVAALTRFAPWKVFFALSKKPFWQPWIHHDDIVNVYLFALQTSTLHGPLNAVAPESVTHQTFVRTIAQALRRPWVLPVPRIIKHLFFKEAIEAVVMSERVVPQRLVDKGFVFTYPTLAVAAATLRKDNGKN
ncbi:MAG TPA: TIGR01777 family oxidoreductase [Candidatus Paceibacterota bacterium]|nr:TIGR01777 family oxidoreductase [Candidatus Paceibacterota bacterium]